ncbi:MAG: sigma factor, partial [Ilumatobacteraceae bacterium]
MLDARAVAAVEQAHRDHWSNVLAATIRVTGDLDLAEECAQEAYARALGAWPRQVPDNPGGWLATAARRLALDRHRRAITARRALPRLAIEAPESAEPE